MIVMETMRVIPLNLIDGGIEKEQTCCPLRYTLFSLNWEEPRSSLEVEFPAVSAELGL
jgi:hypothetical protein